MITYDKVYDEGMHSELTEARYKGVIMKLDIYDDMVFIYGMKSENEGKGDCQEMINLLKEDFKGKRLCSSPPTSEKSKHILDKKGIEYREFMK